MLTFLVNVVLHCVQVACLAILVARNRQHKALASWSGGMIPNLLALKFNLLPSAIFKVCRIVPHRLSSLLHHWAYSYLDLQHLARFLDPKTCAGTRSPRGTDLDGHTRQDFRLDGRDAGDPCFGSAESLQERNILAHMVHFTLSPLHHSALHGGFVHRDIRLETWRTNVP